MEEEKRLRAGGVVADAPILPPEPDLEPQTGRSARWTTPAALGFAFVVLAGLAAYLAMQLMGGGPQAVTAAPEALALKSGAQGLSPSPTLEAPTPVRAAPRSAAAEPTTAPATVATAARAKGAAPPLVADVDDLLAAYPEYQEAASHLGAKRTGAPAFRLTPSDLMRPEESVAIGPEPSARSPSEAGAPTPALALASPERAAIPAMEIERTPAVVPAQEAAPPPAVPAPAADLSRLKVSSIIMGPTGGKAVINGSVVGVGETIDGARIIAITRQTVEVEVGGRLATLRM